VNTYAKHIRFRNASVGLAPDNKRHLKLFFRQMLCGLAETQSVEVLGSNLVLLEDLPALGYNASSHAVVVQNRKTEIVRSHLTYLCQKQRFHKSQTTDA
jgi:hypothetical protein